MKEELTTEGAENTESRFFKMFKPEVHVIKPFDIPKHWKILAAMDYGRVSCAEVVAVDEKGNHYVTNEWVEVDKTTRQKAVSYRDFLEKNRLQKIKTVGDTNMFHRYNDTEADTPSEIFKEYGIDLDHLHKYTPDARRFRVWCNDHTKDLLKFDPEPPKLYFFEGRCPKLLQYLPMLETDKNNPDDIDMEPNIDHYYDALKYCLITIAQGRF